MSLLYTFNEFDQKTCKSYRILGFRIFFAFRRPKNCNSGGHKTSNFIDNIPFTLNPWIRVTDTNTNAKEQQICPSVSIPKRALKLVLCPPEQKKGRIFFFFSPKVINKDHKINFIFRQELLKQQNKVNQNLIFSVKKKGFSTKNQELQ